MITYYCHAKFHENDEQSVTKSKYNKYFPEYVDEKRHNILNSFRAIEKKHSYYKILHYYLEDEIPSHLLNAYFNG